MQEKSVKLESVREAIADIFPSATSGKADWCSTNSTRLLTHW